MEDTFRVNLAEISDTNLDRLVEILVAWKLYGLPATFYDIDHIEFVVKSGKKYDVITCSHIYEHVPDSKKLFEKICSLLEPGGICYFKAIYHDMHEEDKEWFDSVEDYLRD